MAGPVGSSRGWQKPPDSLLALAAVRLQKSDQPSANWFRHRSSRQLRLAERTASFLEDARSLCMGADRRRTTRTGIFQKGDRKSTRLNSSHVAISYAVFCLKKK